MWQFHVNSNTCKHKIALIFNAFCSHATDAVLYLHFSSSPRYAIKSRMPHRCAAFLCMWVPTARARSCKEVPADAKRDEVSFCFWLLPDITRSAKPPSGWANPSSPQNIKRWQMPAFLFAPSPRRHIHHLGQSVRENFISIRIQRAVITPLVHSCPLRSPESI